MSLSQRIACLTVDCQSLDSLLGKLNSVFPSENLAALTDAYKHFEPIYDSSIWKPRYKRLREQLDEFRDGLLRVGLLARLEEVRNFMRSDWPDGVPFETILIPVPDEPRASHADSLGQTQIVELLAEHTFSEQSDTLFHELCHSLWGRADQKTVQKDFEKFDGAIAYFELNEALATALGQGWFRHISYPDEPPGEVWYARDITEKYARGLYPLVRDYMEEGRHLDAAFAKVATQIFAQTCPDVEREVCSTYSVLITSEHAPDCHKLQGAMFAAMPGLRSISWEVLAADCWARDGRSHSGIARRIVLLSPQAIDTLPAHGLNERQILLLKQRETDCICIVVNGCEIIFCFGKDPDAQTDVFLKMLKENYPIPAE